MENSVTHRYVLCLDVLLVIRRSNCGNHSPSHLKCILTKITFFFGLCNLEMTSRMHEIYAGEFGN